MNSKSLCAASLLAFLLLLPGAASAMSFLDFAKMNDDDESTYVALLIDGAAKILRAQGKPDEAARTLALFKSTGPNSGVHQLVDESKRLNALNNKNATNPNNRAVVYDVEDAMELTLRDNDITVSIKDLRTINQNFKPSGLSRRQMSSQAPPP
jgi:hypothetical protein